LPVDGTNRPRAIWSPDYQRDNLAISRGFRRSRRARMRQGTARSAGQFRVGFSGMATPCLTAWRHRGGACGRHQGVPQPFIVPLVRLGLLEWPALPSPRGPDRRGVGLAPTCLGVLPRYAGPTSSVPRLLGLKVVLPRLREADLLISLMRYAQYTIPFVPVQTFFLRPCNAPHRGCNPRQSAPLCCEWFSFVWELSGNCGSNYVQ